MKTKTLSQIALALAVGSSAVLFTACGADESKAPKLGDNILGYEYRKAYQGLHIVSQDDETIIKDVIVRGRDGECSLDKEDLKGQKVNYGETVRILFADKCERKNGALEIEIKTNFGTYKYENKDGKTTLK